jgi:hypothetical protein
MRYARTFLCCRIRQCRARIAEVDEILASPEEPAGSDPRRIIIYSADRDIAGQIHSPRNGLLQAKSKPPDLRGGDSLGYEVLGQCQRLVLRYISSVKLLPAQVARTHSTLQCAPIAGPASSIKSSN